MKRLKPDTSLRKEFYPIPGVLSPVGYRCITLNVPDSDDYVRIFRGALSTLEKWWNYERTGDNSGAIVAQNWRDALLDLNLVGNCNVIQYRLLDCEVLEFSLDGGETWNEVADFSACFVALSPATTARNIIQPTLPSVIPLTIMGQNSQVANLQSWSNYLGNLLAAVLPDGSAEFRGYLQAGNPSVGHFKTSTGIGGELNTDFYGHGGLSYLKFWSSFSGQLLWLMESAYFDSTRFYIYANGQKTAGLTLRDDGKLGLGIDTPLARLHTKIQYAAEIGNIIQLAAGQAYNAEEIRNSSGDILSGRDQLGRHILALSFGSPTDASASEGTIAYDSNFHDTLWIKAAESGVLDWRRIPTEDYWSVQYSDAPDGDSGSASLSGGILDIEFPSPASASSVYGNIGLVKKRSRPSVGNFDEIILFLNESTGWIMLPWELASGDNITIVDCVGWVSHQTQNMIEQGYTGLGTDYFDGSQSTIADGSYLLAGEPIMSLVMQVNAAEFPFERDLYGITDLIAGASLTRVWNDHPRGILCLNTPDIFTDSFYGALQIKVRLTAGSETGNCGATDLTIGLQGYRLKGAGEDPVLPCAGGLNPNPANYSGGTYAIGTGFTSQEKTIEYSNVPDANGAIISIIVELEQQYSIPVVSMDYEVTRNGGGSWVFSWQHCVRTNGIWQSWGGTQMPSTVGVHHYDGQNVGDLGNWDAIAIVITTNFHTNYDYGDSELILNAITLECD